jgi:hypothetical protein
MARWVALTTLGEDKPVMVNLDQVAMMQDIGNKTVLHFNGQQGEGQFVWTVSETLDKINTLPQGTVQAQRLPGSDLYMKGILTLITLALLAHVIIYMSHLPPTQFYMSYSAPTHSPSWFSVLHATDGKTGSW